MIGIMLETGNILFLGGQRLKFPQLIESTTYNIGGVYITNKKIMIVIVSIALMIALHLFITRTKWGMAVRAMAFDYVVVPLVGVPLNKIASMTFAIGSALAQMIEPYWSVSSLEPGAFALVGMAEHPIRVLAHLSTPSSKGSSRVASNSSRSPPWPKRSRAARERWASCS